DERTEVLEQADFTEQIAQLVVLLFEQIFADIGQEVQVASQHRDGIFQRSHKFVSGLLHSTAKVAHDRTGNSERCRNALNAGQDEFRPFGRYLPGAQRPTTPSREGYQQRTSAVFPSCIEVSRPPAIR